MIRGMMRSCPSLILTFSSLLICINGAQTISPLACAAIAGGNSHVINTDQSVIMLWDKERQTQHFVRKANFRTDARDIGFIVPSPSRPQLEESGDAAFNTLADITAASPPPFIPLPSCSVAPATARGNVTVIERKRVAGYDATVLTARSGKDLNQWLKNNGYPYSSALAAWTKPYLGGDWHFTALKLVKDEDRAFDPDMGASSLRISFKTDRPLFPYREPDSKAASTALNRNYRILRIYFIAETQYEGKIRGQAWKASTRWSGDITKHRKTLLRQLGLPQNSGPKQWWLTELENRWRYEQAAGDVYFSPVTQARIIDRDGKDKAYRVDAAWITLIGLGLFLKFRRHARS